MKMILSLMIALSALYADFSRDDTTGIVTDTQTELLWQDDAAASDMNWTAAITQCEGLSLGSHSDWRLPNLNELRSIIDWTRSDPAIDPVFQNTVSAFYWSSTTFGSNPADAWSINFNDGNQDAWWKPNPYYVRCVRGGQ